MSKEKPKKVNMSQVIRDYEATNPAMSTKQIVQGLAARGYTTKANYVAAVRCQAAKKVTAPKERPVEVDDLMSLAPVLEELGGLQVIKTSITTVRRFMEHAGSLERATRMVELYEQFTQKENPV